MSRLDCAIQMRVEKTKMATIAKWCEENGHREALVSASALARWCADQVYQTLVEQGAQTFEYSDEADYVLGELRVFPRTIVTGYMNNLRGEIGEAQRARGMAKGRLNVVPGNRPRDIRKGVNELSEIDADLVRQAWLKAQEENPKLKEMVEHQALRAEHVTASADEQNDSEPDGAFDRKVLDEFERSE